MAWSPYGELQLESFCGFYLVVIIGLSFRGLLFCGLSLRVVDMSFSVETFVAAPKLSELAAWKRSELVALANHLKLEVSTSMRKGDVKKLVSNYLMDENIVSDDEEAIEESNTTEMKRLELQEKEREHEAQFRIKDLEIKEHEIAVQLKAKELELATATAKTPTSVSEKFDVTRHIRFVPPFQETEPCRQVFSALREGGNKFGVAQRSLDFVTSKYPSWESPRSLFSFICRSKLCVQHGKVSHPEGL